MSANVPCRCPDPKIAKRDSWFVSRRNYHRSAFNGYRETWSDYSSVECAACGSGWRTKAAYVASLRDGVRT